MSHRNMIGWTMILASPGVAAGITLTSLALIHSPRLAVMWRPVHTLLAFGVGAVFVAVTSSIGWFLVSNFDRPIQFMFVVATLTTFVWWLVVVTVVQAGLV